MIINSNKERPNYKKCVDFLANEKLIDKVMEENVVIGEYWAQLVGRSAH